MIFCVAKYKDKQFLKTRSVTDGVCVILCVAKYKDKQFLKTRSVTDGVCDLVCGEIQGQAIPEDTQCD